MALPGWRRFAAFCLLVARRFAEERAWHVAASLSYTTLLSLVPFFTVALAAATAFPVFDEAIEALQSFVFNNFLPDARGVETIAQQIQSFTENAGRLTAIGLAFFGVTAVMLMLTIDDTLNRMFRVRRQRALLHRVVIYWAVLTLGPVLIGGSLSMSSYAIGASLGMLPQDFFADVALRLLPFVFTCAALTLLYAVVPFRHVPLAHALTGGVVAGAAFELAKRGFALYLENFPTYTLIYGAFATIPIFLVWLYLSWLIVLAGATLTAMLPAYNLQERAVPPGGVLAEALDILALLARAQGDGRELSLRRITAHARIMPHQCEAILDRAKALGWTTRTDRDAWVLARDADQLSVGDVFAAFVYDARAVGVGEDAFALSLREYSQREQAA
ncbi:MAG TPA: YihY family inner membrane protein [Burkholderiales bacterium]|nr:YihY family inner membrane protein [Burkholderiales bacterium]